MPKNPLRHLRNRAHNDLNKLFLMWHRARIDAQSPVGTVNQDNSQSPLLFVTGFDKSGTTWLRRMLHTHTEIICQGSGQFFNYYREGVHFLDSPGGYRSFVNGIVESNSYKNSASIWLSEANISNTILGLISNTMGQYGQNGSLVADKSTIQDCSLIRELLPEASILVIVRDGRDVAVSFAYQFLRRGSTNKFGDDGTLDPDYLAKVAKAWSDYNEHVLEFANSPNRGKFLYLKYEDLLQEPLQKMAEVLSFLEVSTDAQLLQKIVDSNRFEVLSGGRSGGEEDTTSFFRKGVAGDWQNHFVASELEIFNQYASATLAKLGYEVVS